MSRKKRYIIVCIAYVTKWVEAKTLLEANELSVAYFIYEDIFTQLGVLREVSTNKGTQFTSKII
jgi:hypothetical protein